MLKAWAGWDAKPGAVDTAQAMEEASAETAANLGVPTSILRDKLQQARRMGLNREEALQKVTQEAEGA